MWQICRDHRSSWKLVRGASAKFDFGNPPELTWPQQRWLRDHSLRRQTLKGYPRVLTPKGLEYATPRLGRFEEQNEPATLDPYLPRPSAARPVPHGTEDDKTALQAYD